jgi:hypothetical protein
MGPGYAKLNYSGTVTINSQVCQQINYYCQALQLNNSISTTTYTPYHYTRESNNVVYLYNQNTNVFDTLYDFGATVGSKWLMPANYPGTSFQNPCNKLTLTVLDTGHTNIQSANLKWLKVNITTFNTQYQITDTIYQRFGLLNTYFFNYDLCTGILDYTEGGSLRCFSDNQITNYKRTTQQCNFLPLGMNENEISQNLKLFPNPVADYLTLQNPDLNDQNGRIYFYSVLGEEMKNLPFHNMEKIDTKDLKQGIYFLKFISSTNKIYNCKIIKN